ncbi:MAG TPA: hypothetical protein VFG69_21850, partial [Nannocystaceae bacterium]|nr:hypothetical protein [Nannocystaceae bacterium]
MWRSAGAVGLMAVVGCFDPNETKGSGDDDGSSTGTGGGSATNSTDGTGGTDSASNSNSNSNSASDGISASNSNSASATNDDTAGDTITATGDVDTGVTVGSTGNVDDTAGDTMSDETTGTGSCAGGDVCVPAIPEGWSGPIVVDDACPSDFPTSERVLHEGLAPGVPQCSCSCNIGSVSCQLFLENEGIDFDPVGSCDDPPNDDECLSAIVQASCNESFVDVPASPSWQTTVAACGGATPGAACDGGNCFADAGPLCIYRAADEPCPAGFGDRTLYFGDFQDTRDCTDCSCTPAGQSCEIQVEICSVGFFDVLLESGGSCQQLNSSDGDSVTLISTA